MARLVGAFERTFGATIFFGTGSLTANAKVVHRARFNFFSEARIWYNRGNEDRLPDDPHENVIVLSNEFFEEVTAHPIPTDLEAGSFFHPRLPSSICTCGCPIDALPRKGRNGYRSSGHLALCSNSEGSNMHGRGNSEKSSNNGYKQYGLFGRSALPDYGRRR